MCTTDDGWGNSPTTTSHTCSHMEKPWHHSRWVGVNKEAKLIIITFLFVQTSQGTCNRRLPACLPLSRLMLLMLFTFTALWYCQHLNYPWHFFPLPPITKKKNESWIHNPFLKPPNHNPLPQKHSASLKERFLAWFFFFDKRLWRILLPFNIFLHYLI